MFEVEKIIPVSVSRVYGLRILMTLELHCDRLNFLFILFYFFLWRMVKDIITQVSGYISNFTRENVNIWSI